MSVDPAPVTTGNAMISGSVGRVESTPQLRFTHSRKAALRLSWLATGALLAVLVAPVGTASAIEGLDFETVASPAQEVQEEPVESRGFGVGTFTFSDRLSALLVFAEVVDLTGDVAAAHLHCGLAGANGPVVVDLDPGTSGIIVDEVRFFNEDVIIEEECVDLCGFAINNIASLRQAADNACLYFNVHTEQFPDGEVRGQLLVPSPELPE